MDLHGPYLDEETFAKKAQSIRDEQDTSSDSIFALRLENGFLTEEEVPGDDDGSELCSTCGDPVLPDDEFYASSCGTYCSECMDAHTKTCEVCSKEFDLNRHHHE